MSCIVLFCLKLAVCGPYLKLDHLAAFTPQVWHDGDRPAARFTLSILVVDR
jgi:hypothetical protein